MRWNHSSEVGNLKEVNMKYGVSEGPFGKNKFVGNILKLICELYNSELYSDLQIKTRDGVILAHKLVLFAQGDSWGVNLKDVALLDFSHMKPDIAQSIMHWVYTNSVDFSNMSFAMLLMQEAANYKLQSLISRCESYLVKEITKKNCIELFCEANKCGGDVLEEHCAEFICSHWDEFGLADFKDVPSHLMYKMLKSNTSYPLHASIALRREDVCLYYIEHTNKLAKTIDELDEKGNSPLDLALRTGQMDMAKSLISFGANILVKDMNDHTLLHKAVERRDKTSCLFLMERGIPGDAVEPCGGNTALHMICDIPISDESIKDMTSVAVSLMKAGADYNLANKMGWTPLHLCIKSHNHELFTLLLSQDFVDLEVKTKDGFTPLGTAFEEFQKVSQFSEDLVKRGASVNASFPETGDTLLHWCAGKRLEDVAEALIKVGADVSTVNKKGESALHVAAGLGLLQLCVCLLNNNADPSLKITSRQTSLDPFASDDCDGDDCLRVAIKNDHSEVARVIVEHMVQKNDSKAVAGLLNYKNGCGQTALSIALENRNYTLAKFLLAQGASAEVSDPEHNMLIHQAILKSDRDTALFLIQHGANIHLRTWSGKTPLQLAIENDMIEVIESLCKEGADLQHLEGNCPLWFALAGDHFDAASVLVSYGADIDACLGDPEEVPCPLLFKAIGKQNERVACFLIEKGCSLNVTTKDRRSFTPLHLCADLGLYNTLNCLLEHNADVNKKDGNGAIPLHLAIEKQHEDIVTALIGYSSTDLKMRDHMGNTPFSLAVMKRNTNAAKSILEREPGVAEQFDSQGRNFLHVSVMNSDLESVLFLLSVEVNVHSKTKNDSKATVLHLAVMQESELIVRLLIMAGCLVDDVNALNQTALHVAAEHNRPAMLSILITNGANVNAVDNEMNNALHVAMGKRNLDCVRILLDSSVNSEAYNLKGQTPLHCLAKFDHGNDNAVDVMDCLLELVPSYPINEEDHDGNTALFLAYKKGNGDLCRALVRCGASLGTINNFGESIFNFQVATSQLLMSLLDSLMKEPSWLESDKCLECCNKFGLTTRKHHCRHCGRVLCKKCSEWETPIIKFGLNKPVRVCNVCFDVISKGSSLNPFL